VGKSGVLEIFASSPYLKTSPPGIPGTSLLFYGQPGLPSGEISCRTAHIDTSLLMML